MSIENQHSYIDPNVKYTYILDTTGVVLNSSLVYMFLQSARVFGSTYLFDILTMVKLSDQIF